MKKPAPESRFVCLVYFEGRIFDTMTESDQRLLTRRSMAYDQRLLKAGKLIAAEALQAPAHARMVSVRRGKTLVTDGPFAETKEQLGGFIVIRARTFKQAEKIAAGIPLAKLGRVEVRPVFQMHA